MSGHNKWSTIKRKKGENDAKRGKVLTKVGRELIVAVREGGPDPANNSKLKAVIAKAKAMNVPNDNINRIIKKASGETNGDSFTNITYEGYGPSGIAVIVETLTDNKNRTAGNVRHYFDKFGGNLGTSGCVSFMFEKQGVIVIDNEEEELDEDTVMEAALEAGASDFNYEDGMFEIKTEPNELNAVRDSLEAQGYTFAQAEVAFVPATYTSLTDEHDILMMNKLIENLEDDDDVQNVWHNWENPEE